MRKVYDSKEKLFSEFSASLVAGDTVIFSDTNIGESVLGYISLLLRRGVVVRVPAQEEVDQVLRNDPGMIEALACLAAAMDRKVLVRAQSTAEKLKAVRVKKDKYVLEGKVHRLVADEGLGVVEACRKVHCRPSDYYIYRGKLKQRSYGG